jgi:hypothetical protein
MRHQERFGRLEPKEEAKREKREERRRTSCSFSRHDDEEEHTTTHAFVAAQITNNPVSKSPPPPPLLHVKSVCVAKLEHRGKMSSPDDARVCSLSLYSACCRSPPLRAKIPYFWGFPFHAFAASVCRLFSLKSRPSAFQSTCRGPSSPNTPPPKAGSMFR